MKMLSKFSNFPNELSKNDELREYELSGSDCISHNNQKSNQHITGAYENIHTKYEVSVAIYVDRGANQ